MEVVGASSSTRGMVMGGYVSPTVNDVDYIHNCIEREMRLILVLIIVVVGDLGAFSSSTRALRMVV